LQVVELGYAFSQLSSDGWVIDAFAPLVDLLDETRAELVEFLNEDAYEQRLQLRYFALSAIEGLQYIRHS
jgi:hypothetical protein